MGEEVSEQEVSEKDPNRGDMMTQEILTAIKRMACKHEYRLLRWHWTHGINGNEPAFIEAELRCEKCGRVEFYYPERGSFAEDLCILRKDVQY